ncbi:single-stranded DNA-binding protein [Microbacterium oryzae]|uniref:single-stranded DNA-binding protein n=1 Tax=Microbacterium oryzae TaxID=743009 RepID=UPI0025AEF965|nr:single-stranded DNA-binding protein [Microbacterium oryzae]MDN3310234.1 single-stranded DNA-binding protein [Microbacterium oryzae]
MTYITRIGDLEQISELHRGEGEPYAQARVLVLDEVDRAAGVKEGRPAAAYDVLVSGAQATALVEAAQRSTGRMRLFFAGTTEDRPADEAVHRVRADEVGVSLLDQTVTVHDSDQSVAQTEPWDAPLPPEA